MPAVASRSLTESVAEELGTRLRDFIPEVMRITGTPGLSISVACGEDPPWEAAFGYRDLATRTPMTTDTVTRGGSLAKLFVAIAAMQLVERGVMGLHTPVVAYLDDLEARNPLGEREITLYDLLTHRSGLATDTIEACLDVPRPLADFVRAALRDDIATEYNLPRSRWAAKVGERPQ